MRYLFKIFITVAIGLCLIILFSTCKKYSEDGKRSWHKPEKRILGNWYLKEYLVDGVESAYNWNEYYTGNIADTVRWQLIDAVFSFYENETTHSPGYKEVAIYIEQSHVLSNIITNILIDSRWLLYKSKSALTIYSKESYNVGGVYGIFSIFGNVSDIWDIKKLTDKELILECNSNDNKHLRIKLQK